jgi:hypothetical protein
VRQHRIHALPGAGLERGQGRDRLSGAAARVRPDGPARRPQLHAQDLGLFAEYAETGINGKLGYNSSASLRAAYPKFFWSVVTPYIGDALSNLQMTQEGKLWVANLYSHVFAEEHKLPTLGAERLRA